MTYPGPFSARFFLLLVSVVQLGFYIFKEILEIRQQKKPLPEAVAGIYDSQRYSSFISRDGEVRRAYLIYNILDFIIGTCILFSPIFAAIERLTGGNVYISTLITFFLYYLAGRLIHVPYDYYHNFVIDEKYGLNKMTRKSFARDQLLSMVVNIIFALGASLIFTFCGEHMAVWTKGFTVGWKKTVLIGLGLYGVLMLFSLAISLLEFFILKKRYTFTPLPQGELREKIHGLMAGCKKKVKEIYVYDQSTKSTKKNAFLIKLLWHREFGIADNFINENDEGELLAVLSHEIGHLKHKKGLLDYMSMIISAALLAFLVSLLCYPTPALWVAQWVRDSFQTSQNNYYVLLNVYLGFIRPIVFVISLFSNYKSRRDEYEADMEAVKNGYGEELISTFSKMTSDELIELAPHPFLEWLDYDHPSMFRRISYIRAETERRKQREPAPST